MAWTLIFGGTVLMAFGLLWYIVGYSAGVKETERRWREAVGRADEARREKGSK